ncbi:MAG: heme-binding protein [Bacteroidota bacterium]
MKTIFLLIMTLSTISYGQNKIEAKKLQLSIDSYVKSVDNLTLEAALELTKRVNQTANSLNKNISVAIVDASGTPILITRGDQVGPHNTEASRKKAFTALSTKTPTLQLLRSAAANPDTKNLNSLPELLLLSGGAPIWFKGNIIGSIGVSGGGSPENDDLIAKSATIPELGITTK